MNITRHTALAVAGLASPVLTQGMAAPSAPPAWGRNSPLGRQALKSAAAPPPWLSGQAG
jgi:hypothetical protein